MYQELIDLIEKHPQYFQSAKNMIARSITDDTDNENNQKLKKTLLRSIQKNNTYEVSKMLVWLFTQESQFDQALKCEISIDKRFLNNTASIISTSEIALSNEDYETAISGLEYVVKNSHSNSYAYEYSTLKILDIKFQIIDQQKVKKKIDLEKMGNEYANILQEIGVKSETIYTLKNYCYLLSTYLNQEQDAIQILEAAINNPLLDSYDIAICKMELAQTLICVDNIWEASLIYAQVEKEFKDDIIGQQAKFEKTKISYYESDFEWAQSQLKILKLSTSKLIANNAMKLSLLISDNLNLDTSDTALSIYANAELLFRQKKYDECLTKLEDLESLFPNHSLVDEVLLHKCNVFIQKNNYDAALQSLKKIIKEHSYDILYDDALFYQGEIYEQIMNDKQKAKATYEELLLKAPNSIFIKLARERYRKLRENNLLKL